MHEHEETSTLQGQATHSVEKELFFFQNTLADRTGSLIQIFIHPIVWIFFGLIVSVFSSQGFFFLRPSLLDLIILHFFSFLSSPDLSFSRVDSSASLLRDSTAVRSPWDVSAVEGSRTSAEIFQGEDWAQCDLQRSRDKTAAARLTERGLPGKKNHTQHKHRKWSCDIPPRQRPRLETICQKSAKSDVQEKQKLEQRVGKLQTSTEENDLDCDDQQSGDFTWSSRNRNQWRMPVSVWPLTSRWQLVLNPLLWWGHNNYLVHRVKINLCPTHSKGKFYLKHHCKNKSYKQNFFHISYQP